MKSVMLFTGMPFARATSECANSWISTEAKSANAATSPSDQ